MNQWKVGDVTITRIIEGETPAPGTILMPDATGENIHRERDWLVPVFADEKGNLKMSVHALVIESRGKRIMVDTCVGNDKIRTVPSMSRLQLPFLQDLEKAGYRAEQIDHVV